MKTSRGECSANLGTATQCNKLQHTKAHSQGSVIKISRGECYESIGSGVPSDYREGSVTIQRGFSPIDIFLITLVQSKERAAKSG